MRFLYLKVGEPVLFSKYSVCYHGTELYHPEHVMTFYDVGNAGTLVLISTTEFYIEICADIINSCIIVISVIAYRSAISCFVVYEFMNNP